VVPRVEPDDGGKRRLTMAAVYRAFFEPRDSDAWRLVRGTASYDDDGATLVLDDASTLALNASTSLALVVNRSCFDWFYDFSFEQASLPTATMLVGTSSTSFQLVAGPTYSYALVGTCVNATSSSSCQYYRMPGSSALTNDVWMRAWFSFREPGTSFSCVIRTVDTSRIVYFRSFTTERPPSATVPLTLSVVDGRLLVRSMLISSPCLVATTSTSNATTTDVSSTSETTPIETTMTSIETTMTSIETTTTSIETTTTPIETTTHETTITMQNTSSRESTRALRDNVDTIPSPPQSHAFVIVTLVLIAFMALVVYANTTRRERRLQRSREQRRRVHDVMRHNARVRNEDGTFTNFTLPLPREAVAYVEELSDVERDDDDDDGDDAEDDEIIEEEQ